MEDFVNCINRARPSHKEKKEYIDYFQEYYDYALRETCQSSDDLEYWKKLLKTKYANRRAFLDEIKGI